MLKKIVTGILLMCSCHVQTADLQYSRYEEKPNFKVLRQKRATKQPYFFAQIQSYRIVENYLHYWIDRPLFHDSSLRNKQSYPNSFLHNVEILKDYEINGFVSLSNALIKMYEEHLQALDKTNPPSGFRYLYGAMYAADYNPTNPNEKWKELYVKSYQMAENSPYTLKINGKIPIWAYNSQLLKPKVLKETTRILYEKSSTEALIFAEISDSKLQTLYLENGKLSDGQVALLRKMMEDLLDECGGIIVKPVINMTDPKGDYTGKASVSGYYRDYLIPLLLELLGQPRYQEKMIGAYVSKGYINHLSGNNAGEYGTYRFRLFMDELFLINPDFVVFFEWNEANENTHFQPTVNDAKTMQRLIKFYARKMRGQLPVPNSGDDLSVPNLVFSSRQVLRLGDILRYELLNIPDSNSDSKYQVQLVIRNFEGEILKEFPEETFKIAEMKAVSFEIPTEQLSEQVLILPELRVTNSEGKKFLFSMQYNRLHPSVCWNYKEVMQPLRDMLQFSSDFEVNITNTRKTYDISGQIKSPETLRQVEILDNESEVFAVDREKQYDPQNNIILQGSLTAFTISTRKIIFEVLDATGWQWFRDCYRYKSDEADPQVTDNKVTVPNYQIHYYYQNPFIITIPKNATQNAVLKIDIAGIGRYSIKISELQTLGKVAKAFDGNTRLDLSIVKNLVDIPVPLLQKQVKFATHLESENRFPIYQLRAISNSGKIYRSRPVMPIQPSGEPVEHNVFSVAKKQAQTVMIAKDRIPELNYLFDGSYGAILRNSWEPFFDAQLGGGFTYLEPFNRPRPNLLAIPKRKFLHPGWKDSDGTKVLEFDGLANYINFPRETLPYGSFTLEFEIKPEGDEAQVLFRNFSYHWGSLNLYRRQGKLEASFSYRNGEISNPAAVENFKPELEIPTGKWSKITVCYNLKTLKFTVNEKTCQYPFNERGVFFKPSVFGGHTLPVREAGRDAHFFKGLLRSLRIYHSTE